MDVVRTQLMTTITEFKKNPNVEVERADGKCFAVLTNNRPSFYVLPPELYDQLAELIYDIEISKVVEQRLAENRPRVKVRIEDL